MLRRTRLTALVASGLCSIAGLAVAPAGASARPGDLDRSWGGTGFVTTSFGGDFAVSQAVAVRDDRTVAVGVAGSGQVLSFAAARYRDNGSLDQSFGSGGKVTTAFFGSDQATSAAYQGDKLVVAGFTSPDNGATFEWAIARYNKNGSLDQSFGSGGKVTTSFGDGNDFADAVAVDDNKIVVVGAAQSPAGQSYNFALARYNRDGSLDQSFGTGGKVTTDFTGGFDAANGVKFVGDEILAAGYTNYPNSNFALALYRENGTLDPAFGTGGLVTTDFGHGASSAHAVDVSDGRIVAIGSAFSASGNQDFAAAQYNRRGVLDPHFGSGGKATVDLGGNSEAAFGGAFAADGRVVAVGGTPDGFNGPDFGVAQFTPRGVPDPGFGPGTGFVTTLIGTQSAAQAMALGPDQKIVAAGYSDNSFAVARYLGKKQDQRSGDHQGSGD